MCGICGIVHFDPQKPASRDLLAAMNRRILHRGPDDEGLYLDRNVGLGVRRLSIIDCKAGHQPMANEEGSVWLAYNGEIYNHEDLRKDLVGRGHLFRTRSDTETIIHLYEEQGREWVRALRGMFAFALWDARTRRLFAARDRFGIKPFYYFQDRNQFLFGSEIKALLACPEIRACLNENSLPEHLAYGYLSGPETLFEGIRKLPPGHTLELEENGELNIRPYWELQVKGEHDTRPRGYYVDTYRAMLEEAVASHLMSDVSLGMYLSGGLDSSVIAALMTRICRQPIRTFSVGYAEPESSELSHAKTVARHLQSQHHEVMLSEEDFFRALPQAIWYEDEPMAWPSNVALCVLAKHAKEHATVVLTGEGSDETLAGYTRYPFTLWNASIDRWYRSVIPSSMRRTIRNLIESSRSNTAAGRAIRHAFPGRDGDAWEAFYFDNFYSAFSVEQQNGLLSLRLRDKSGAAHCATMDVWAASSGGLLQRMLLTDVRTYLVEMLMRQDKMSMAASVESRVPFLDHPLAEFAVNIPPALSTRGLAGKQILKEIARDVLPKSIVHRRKSGFPTPWAVWLQGERLDQIQNMVLHPRSLRRDLFEADAVKHIFADHRSGRRNHADRIWRLLNLELWHRVFIDGESTPTENAGSDAEMAVSPRQTG